jgi:hypothetical protein
MNPLPADGGFCLLRDDAFFRMQKRVGLVPRNGKDGVVRRTLFFCLLAWLPLAIWAFVGNRVFDNATGEPLLHHYSIHVRFLIALPALILGERLARSTTKRMLPRFEQMGLVAEDRRSDFHDLINGMVRLRDSTLPWVAVAGVILAGILTPETSRQLEELNWAQDGSGLGFGGWWFLLVSRPIYQLFFFAWVWRLVLMFVLFRRIVRFGLDLLPQHPDRLGGLGFFCGTPRAFSPLAFAASCQMSARWAHDIAWHGAHVSQLELQVGIFVALILVVCLFPLTVFLPLLKRTKRKGLSQYGGLVARYDRLVGRIWIRGETVVERELLEASELGPSCDIHMLYDSVRNMRIIPMNKNSLLPLLIPLALPLLAASTIEIPLMELVGKVFKTLL